MQQYGLYLPGGFYEDIPCPANDRKCALSARLATWTEPIDRLPDDVPSLRALLAEVTQCFESENELLRGALQFYADRSHIKVGEFGVAVEDGKRAQDALTRSGR